MVLPGRIELPTSPLPRECSTTELRQRTLRFARADTCHRRRACATPSLDARRVRAENRKMTGRKTTSEERKERLARALKRNIARRKEQGKDRKPAANPPDPPPDDNGCPN